ncbi:MAG: ribosomal-processing cysteine protease Prp [Tissierellia bacterium]|nr:ribosomal-processing cysteine protease Prp [Tissierellia bacterium]
MVKVTLYKKNQNVIGFKTKGHANTVEPGELDLVCAAISMLTQTTIESLVKVAGLKEEEIVYKMEDGYLSLEPDPSYENNDKIQIIFSVLETGLDLLVESYGKSIEVIQEVQRC